MKSDKEIHNFLVGYVLGERIRKVLESGLGLFIVVILWAIPLWIFNFLGIGHS